MENVLPKGWASSKLGYLGQYLNGRAFKPNEWKLEGLPIVRIQNLNNEDAPFNYTDKIHEQRYLIDNNTLLMAWSASLGVYFWDKGPAWLNQHIFKVLPNEKLITKRFLYYCLSISIDDFYRKTHGTGMVHITKPVFENHEIPLPPLSEQERIVAKLDKLFAQHEKIKKALDRIPQLLKTFRQQVLTQAVTGTLTEQWREGKKLEDADIFIRKVISDRNENDRTLKRKLTYKFIEGSYEIPDKWSFSFLQNLGEFTRGRSKHRPRNDKKLFNGAYPFIQTGDVSNATMYINEYKNTYSEFGLKQSRLFPKGTLCVTIAANIAETAILNFDSCFPDSVVGYVPYRNLYSSEFAMYFIKTIQKELEHFAPATAQKNINMAILGEIPFPVPPLQEQQEIVHRVESLFFKADAIETRYQTLKAKINNLPQAILHKAFKGELVPQLTTDGDAMELLAEIMALKKDVKKKGKA
ncbi:restriction endonuclease subunit S [Sphingobacterium sp. WOUb80]|uniref:restriction endonuclease subunit S n=1 Tax=Sphingobacterium sp. WOUb80 TaxID=3234028 RepID=UPI003CEE7F30